MASRANHKTLYSCIHLTNTYYDTLTHVVIIQKRTTNGSATCAWVQPCTQSVYKCALRGTGCEVLHGPIDTDLTSSGWCSKAMARVDTSQCSTFSDRIRSTGTGLMSRMHSFFTLRKANTLSARIPPAPEHRQERQ